MKPCVVRMKPTSGSGCWRNFSSARATALGSMTTSSCSSLRSNCSRYRSSASRSRTLFALLTAWNFEPSMAIHSPFTKPTERASRTNSAPAAVTPSRCMRRNSAIVLWSGASRPSNHYQLDVPPALRLQPPRGTDLLQIAVQVEFQQIAWIITRPPGLGRLGALKSQTRHVQSADKCIDDPAHMIVRNQLFQADGKQRSLSPAFSLHKAHKKMPSLSRRHLLIYFRPINRVS